MATSSWLENTLCSENTLHTSGFPGSLRRMRAGSVTICITRWVVSSGVEASSMWLFRLLLIFCTPSMPSTLGTEVAFSHGHGGGALQLTAPGLEHAVVVEPVTEFVRQGADHVQRAVEAEQNPGFLDHRHGHAEGAAAVAGALFGVDPAAVEGASGKIRQVRREFGK